MANIGKQGNGAQKRTRTSTPLRAPAPEAGASTNSAIWARGREGELGGGGGACQQIRRAAAGPVAPRRDFVRYAPSVGHEWSNYDPRSPPRPRPLDPPHRDRCRARSRRLRRGGRDHSDDRGPLGCRRPRRASSSRTGARRSARRRAGPACARRPGQSARPGPSPPALSSSTCLARRSTISSASPSASRTTAMANSFYIRPHQNGNPNSTQYTPVVNGSLAWQIFTGDGFTSQHRFNYGQLDARAGRHLCRVRLDHDRRHAGAGIPHLKSRSRHGALGLTSVHGAYFANFSAVPIANYRDPNPAPPSPPLAAGIGPGMAGVAGNARSRRRGAGGARRLVRHPVAAHPGREPRRRQSLAGRRRRDGRHTYIARFSLRSRLGADGGDGVRLQRPGEGLSQRPIALCRP